MNRLQTFAAAAFTVAATALPFSSGALADAKVFQASSICRGPLTFDTITGAVKNLSKFNPILAFCAINRDVTNAKPTSVQVTVVDNSSLLIGDGDFTCNLIVVGKAGNNLGASTSVSSSGVNSNGQTLNVPVPGTVPADGTLTLKCKIPRRGTADPASLIGSIKVVEPDPGN